MSAYKALMSPFQLRHLTLKNRIMSSGHAPGYAEDGKPKARYQLYHEEKAKGGIGLTIFGGGSNIARESGSVFGQIYVGSDDVIPYLREFSDRIHKHDCAIMCQITHMGRHNYWYTGEFLPNMGPSIIRDPAHRAVPREMNHRDIARVVKLFGDAAMRCKEGGLDGVEIMCSMHLIGQFVSTLSNRRTDEYGGSLENRTRFLREVVGEVRTRVGDDFVVGVRYQADESNEGGISAEEGIEVGRILGRQGVVDFLNVNGAYSGTAHGIAEAYPGMVGPSAPYIELARRVREASGVAVFQAARLSDPATADFAVSQGYLDLAGMTRPHIADPHLIRKIAEGREDRIRPCVGAGYCMDRAYFGQGALCLHNPATGRETVMPHEIEPADERKTVVVIGGGPGGLEAARVAAERGHDVTLFEATDRLGGQINLAAKAGWRKSIIGISDWLASELEYLGVTVHLNRYADKGDVLALRPDVVIVATGGFPNTDLPEGGDEHTVSCFDVLGGQAKMEGRILLYDDGGSDAGMSTAQYLAEQGLEIEFVTPDRAPAHELGAQNYPVYLRELYRNGASFVPDRRIEGVRRNGNALAVTL